MDEHNVTYQLIGSPVYDHDNYSIDKINTEGGNFNSSNESDSIVSAEEREFVSRVFGIRFIPYTIFAIVGICFNILSLLAMQHRRGYRTVHHVLLYNLAVCDMIGSILLWMYYNSPLLFPTFDIISLKHCLFKVMALVAPFILSRSISMLSLLMLALNQYIAICNPLFSTANVTKGKALLCILITWLVSLILSVIPGILLLFMTKFQHCTMYAGTMSVKSIEICAYALVGIIVIIVALYARIYRIIVNYRKHTPTMIRRNRNNGSDTESNYKAFMTTLLLTGTLIIFWLPYVVFHFLSAHVNTENIPYSAVYIKLYLIDFLPMFVFITDPIIYGIRMREIRSGYQRLLSRIFPCCVKQQRHPTYRTSVRFTTVDNSIATSI